MARTLVQSGNVLRPRQSRGKVLLHLARTKPLGAIFLGVLVGVVLVAIFADVLAPHDPIYMIPDVQLRPPSAQFWMGTDNYGRDILSRVILGARISLTVGVGAVTIDIVLGTIIGLVSGYFGGKLDMAIQRVMDGVMGFPTLLLAILIMAVLGPGMDKVILVIGLVSAPRLNRVVRGAVLSLKESDYVLAARSIGARNLRIILVHVLPGVVAHIIVLGSLAIGGAIMSEASLSFLGLGIPPPAPSWGRDLGGEAQRFMQTAPWMAFFPGLALAVVVLSINMLGDALRDVLDPRLRGTQ